MSLGIFRSIRGSYVESARKEADLIVAALNRELAARQLPVFVDSDPDESLLRNLPCGNAGASTFGALAARAHGAGLTWTLGSVRGERQIALPLPFDGKFAASMGRLFFLFTQHQEFCSVRTVVSELEALAPLLGIPLSGGTVTEEIADRLADCQTMPGDEEEGVMENERSLWLDLHLACHYSLEDGTPVVIG